MASDLRYCGYKRLDVLRIYGFNLILLPVNLAGTFVLDRAGHHRVQGAVHAHAEGPEPHRRAAVLVIAPYLLIALAGYTLYSRLPAPPDENLVYAALNVVLACYAVMAFIGLRNSVVDAWIHFTSLLYKPARTHRRRAARQARGGTPAPAVRLAQRAGGRTDRHRPVVAAGWLPRPRRASREVAPRPGTAVVSGTVLSPGTELRPGGRVRPTTWRCWPRSRGAGCPCCASWWPAVCWLAWATAGTWAGSTGSATVITGPHQTWFAPYVDVTLPPTYQFQNASANPAQQTVLGFVVADAKPRARRAGAARTPWTRPTRRSPWAPGSRSCSRTARRPSCPSAASRTPASTWPAPAWPA